MVYLLKLMAFFIEERPEHSIALKPNFAPFLCRVLNIEVQSWMIAEDPVELCELYILMAATTAVV